MQGRREKSRYRYGQPNKNYAANGFICDHCHGFIYTGSRLPGVKNRNHCPYCLWSRHLDLYVAGDRLSACKSLMQPVGLTIKHTRKKYGISPGELMLVHLCEVCNNLSINRVAADDIPKTLFAVFEGSFQIDGAIHDSLEYGGIRLLEEADSPLVLRQLFGYETSLAEILFQGSAIEIV